MHRDQLTGKTKTKTKTKTQTGKTKTKTKTQTSKTKTKPPVIENLTPEQEAPSDVYVTRWLQIGLDGSPADRPRAERAVRALYAQEGLAEPIVHWADSPDQAIRELEQAGLVAAWFFGQHAANWLSFYEFMREVVGLREETEDMLPLFELAKSCGWVS